MADQYTKLRAAVEEKEQEINERREGWDDAPDVEYTIQVNEHHDGPALDIWKVEDGERVVPEKVFGGLVQPALDTGWVPSGTNRAVNTSLRQGDHIRIFLRDADDVVDVATPDEVSPSEDELDEARLDGFAAGILAATMWHAQFPSLEALYPEVEDDEPMGEDEAREWLGDHNTFPNGAVISANEDVDGDLYVYAPNTAVSEVETPDGWTAFYDGHGRGIGFLPEDEVDDHIDAWAGFFEGDEAIAEDIDANETIRELEGVETPEECVEAIQDECGDGAAHVTELHGDGPFPYIASFVGDEDIPDGWTRGDGHSHHAGSYLVKE